MTETNEGVAVTTENTDNEQATNETQQESNVVKLSKEDYDLLQSTLGSLKREVKDLKKPKPTETEAKSDDSALLDRVERLAIQSAGVTHPEDVELARSTAKKWNMNIEDVLVDVDFKTKLERQQTDRANKEATSNVQGGSGTNNTKNTAEFYIKRGTPPTRAEVPDGETRRKIARAFLQASETGGKKFYNE